MKFILILFFFASFPSFSANKTYQAIDTNGTILFTIEAEFIYAFSDGVARIKQLNLVNNKWVRGYGYINKAGEVVVPCIYKKAFDFVDDRAWVKRENENHWTLINKKGEVISTKQYEKVGYIIEGYSDRIAVYQNGQMGWINRDGKEVIACQYLGSSTFDKEFGLACVTAASGSSEKYGFINKEGAVIIPFQYSQSGPSSFKNGYCRVNVKGKTVLIDQKGKVVFTPKYNSLQDYSQGLMPVVTKPNRDGWGYCNMENVMIVPGIYQHATSINEDGYGIIELKGKKGLIDSTGTLLLDLKYETVYADPTNDGYICGVLPTEEVLSLSDTPKDYFDIDLNPIDIGKRTLMPANGSNRIPFALDRKRGYMDRNFNVVIPAKYAKATDFNDGIALVRL